MDSAENEVFDMEAQLKSFLDPQLAEEVAGTTTTTTTTDINAAARKMFFRIILLNRSATRFKLAAADVHSDYGVIGSSDHQQLLIQGSGDAAPAAEVPMEIFSAPSASADECEQNSRLQLKNINEIVRGKKLDDLHRYGGVSGIAEALNTDLLNGISIDEAEIIAQSVGAAGQIIEATAMFLHSLLAACKNLTFFLLSIAAIFSFISGVIEDGLAQGWYDGAVIFLIAIAIVVFPATLNYWGERMSRNKLENLWEMAKVRVVRNGCPVFVLADALRIGDIVVLRKGDQVPADGIFVDGESLEVVGEYHQSTINGLNPFILYPSRVINGDAKMIVTAIGIDTGWGEMLNNAVKSDNKFKLEDCLHKAGKLDDGNGSYMPDPKGEPTRVKTILEEIKRIFTKSKGTARILTTLLGVSLLGIMESLPFVICIAIMILNRKALAYKASMREYLACVKMASVTTVCSDKHGGLTEHEFAVDKFFVGGELVSESSVVASDVLEGLCDGIRTLFLIRRRGGCCDPKLDQLISWAETTWGMKEESSFGEQCSIISGECCDPFQQCCQIVVTKEEEQSRYCFYLGPPQHILCLCSHYYDIGGESKELDGDKRRVLDQAIDGMLIDGEEMIAYARERLNGCDTWPIQSNGISYMGMASLKDTERAATRTAMSKLRSAGIRTVIVSGDDVEVLKNGGVLDPDDPGSLMLTAKEFSDWTEEEKMDRVERICILGNCLPSDKIGLIKCLQGKGQVVAFMAQQTVDAPALAQADIGITFGAWSSEIAREFGDINILDSCYLGVVASAVEAGRCFLENVRKYIQLQLIFAISSSSINFIATVALGDAPITALQLFWLNLVVAFLGGLALLTGPPPAPETDEVTSALSQKLITKGMWRNIAIQASYQTTVFVALQHRGEVMMGIDGDRVKSMIYNGFFLCQAFNKFIAREPEKKNILSGLSHARRHRWFWAALVLTVVAQAGFAAAERAGLKWKVWGVCLLVGLISCLLDWLGKIVSKCIRDVVSS
ncbi:calcium-transporting ATPase 12, plasma membrane-type-like isoform X2 [Andrographis paniculata]|uniref:calcium-transporting ATPase 12, plasma membrane-type-like isoform X2 n=1 Tax=Andrographis paniculata TaxID=175694 RepID=UPI0021E8988A|nr:calcium-transporting ATPase 12, plasma membrane-type-like isoform X2 [Andrographis paniculata]